MFKGNAVVSFREDVDLKVELLAPIGFVKRLRNVSDEECQMNAEVPG